MQETPYSRADVELLWDREEVALQQDTGLQAALSVAEEEALNIMDVSTAWQQYARMHACGAY